jgi:hypothetical protein
VVAFACGGSGREYLVETPQVPIAEIHVESGDILVEIFAALGARDRDDIIALSEHPGERYHAQGMATVNR